MMTMSNHRYLRYIYQLHLKNEIVRQIDLALALGFARSSVSIAVKQLKELDLIIVDGKNICLTKQGELLARKSLVIYQKVYQYLLSCGIDNYKATNYADKLESNFDEQFINVLIENKTKHIA